MACGGSGNEKTAFSSQLLAFSLMVVERAVVAATQRILEFGVKGAKMKARAEL